MSRVSVEEASAATVGVRFRDDLRVGATGGSGALTVVAEYALASEDGRDATATTKSASDAEDDKGGSTDLVTLVLQRRLRRSAGGGYGFAMVAVRTAPELTLCEFIAGGDGTGGSDGGSGLLLLSEGRPNKKLGRGRPAREGDVTAEKERLVLAEGRPPVGEKAALAKKEGKDAAAA